MSFDVALRCFHLIFVVVACSCLLILFYGLVLQIVDSSSFYVVQAVLGCVKLCCFTFVWF